MHDSHRDLLITAEEWESFVDDLNQPLDKFEVPQPQQEQPEMLAIIDNSRDDIELEGESEAEPGSGWGA